MKKILLLASAALFIILLPGCVVSSNLRKAQVEQIKTVAVISHMSQSFHRKYLGFTAFGNENESKFIPETVVDRDYENQLSDELRRGDRFKIIDISSEREELLAGDTSVGKPKSTLTPDQHFASIEPKLKRIAQKFKLDGFFFLTPRSVEIELTNQSMKGIGLFASGQNPEKGSSWLHVFGAISILDANGKLVAARQVTRSNNVFADFKTKQPFDNINGVLARTSLEKLSESQKAELRVLLPHVLKTSWAPTITALLTSDDR